MQKPRIYGVTTESKETQIRKWAEELGIEYAVFCALAVWIGAKKLAEMHDLDDGKRDRKWDTGSPE